MKKWILFLTISFVSPAWATEKLLLAIVGNDDKATTQHQNLYGVGFLLRDKAGRWYIATAAHITAGDARLNLAGHKILNRISDSFHDVVLLQIESLPESTPHFDIDETGKATILADSILLQRAKINKGGDELITAPWLYGAEVTIAYERISNLMGYTNSIRQSFLGAINIESAEDRKSLVRFRPGFSGSPIVRLDQTSKVTQLVGIAKSFNRFFFESQAASSQVLANLYLELQKGNTGEVSKVHWQKRQCLTYRQANDGSYAESAPLAAVSGGGESGDSGDSDYSGGMNSCSTNTFDIFNLVSQGAYVKVGSSKIFSSIQAIEGPCFDQARSYGDCRYYPRIEVLEQARASGVGHYKYLTAQDLKNENLSQLNGLSEKRKRSLGMTGGFAKVEESALGLQGQTYWSSVTVRPDGANLKLRIDLLIPDIDTIETVITAENYTPVLRVQSQDKKQTYFIQIESLLYHLPDSTSRDLRFIRIRQAESDLEDWVRLDRAAM